MYNFIHRFAINLQCGLVGDIAFHYNPRFDQGTVVRNTHVGGWGGEELAGSMPFTKNQRFEILIQVEAGCYRVCLVGMII